MTRPRHHLAAALLIAGLVLVSNGTATAAPRVGSGVRRTVTTTGTVARVRIVDFAFRPRAITVSRGTRVRWVNRGSVAHTTTSNTGLWDSGRLAPGDTFSRVFRRAGTFRYHCTIHSDMKGRVVVQ
jgi:plastocyanin